MKATNRAEKIAFYYLASVPFLTIAIGFGIGHSPARVYIPVWMVHTCVVLLLLRRINGGNAGAAGYSGRVGYSGGGGRWSLPGYLLVFPWVLFSIFAGFGPPPSTAQAWVGSMGEQETRYLILVAGGICAGTGFCLLKELTATTAGARYSTIAMALVSISIPLFIINMLYWGFFLSASFQSFVSRGAASKPDWYIAVRELFYWVDSVQLSLFYMATALFAVAFKAAGFFKRLPSNIYIVICFIAMLCSLLPPGVPAPFDTIAYITAVPAIGFIMPYLMGLNLIRASKDA